MLISLNKYLGGRVRAGKNLFLANLRDLRPIYGQFTGGVTLPAGKIATFYTSCAALRSSFYVLRQGLY